MRINFLFLFLILLALPVYSEIEVIKYYPVSDFDLSLSNIDLCSCQGATQAVLLENTGNQKSTYSISLDGLYSSITPSTVSLDGGEYVKLILAHDIPCDYTGSYVNQITVQSETKLKKYSQQVNTGTCQNLVVVPIKTKAEILPCRDAIYSLEVRNSGPFAETYTLELDTDASFSDNDFILAGKGRKNVSVLIQPDCHLTHDNKYNLKVLSKYSDLEAVVPLDLSIIPDYNFTLSTDTPVTVCSEVETTLGIDIKNTADTKSRYTLNSDSPIITIDDDTINLSGGDRGRFEFTVQAEPGEYYATLEVVSEYGTAVQKEISIDSKKCYELKLDLENSNLCVGDDFEFDLENLGEFDSDFKVEVVDHDYAEFDVDSGDSKDFSVEVRKPGEYDLLVKVTQDSYTEEFSFPVKILDGWSCIKPVLEQEYVHVNTSEANFDLDISNAGLKESKYQVIGFPENWISVFDKTIYMEPGETKDISVFTDAPNEGKTFTNLVLKSENYTYHLPIELDVYNLTLMQKITKYRCMIVLSILFVIALLLFIMMIFSFGKARFFPIALIFILLLIAGLIVLFMCFENLKVQLGMDYVGWVNETQRDCPYKESICDSDRYISWDEDTSYELDMSRYFEDPDADDLIYGATETANIEIGFSGDRALFKPDKDWYGTRDVVFSADDSRGGYAESDLFFLHVKDTKEFILNDYVLDNYGYIIAVVILILLICLILLIFKGFSVGSSDEDKPVEKRDVNNKRRRSKK